MHLEAAINWVWRYTAIPWSCEPRGHDCAGFEMQLETMIEHECWGSLSWSMVGRPGTVTLLSWWLNCISGNATGCHYHSAFRAIWLLVFNLTETHARSSRYNQRSSNNHLNECNTVNHQLMLYTVYAVLGICCTGCILYLEYIILSGYCTLCYLIIMTWRDWESWLNFIFYNDGTVADNKVRERKRMGMI